MKNEFLIIEIRSEVADLHEMSSAVTAQTGDYTPIFCPEVVEGKPFNGHAHTIPPAGVVFPDTSPIILR